jgi:hypothetical protein
MIATLISSAFVPIAFAGEAHKEGPHEFHRHHMALLLGNTQSEDGENGLSVGVDYEYRINRWLGIGGLVEYSAGDFEHLLLIAPLFIHPYKGWLLNVSLGAEVHKEHGDHEGEKRTRDWIVRTGVAYQFHVGERYSIAPEFNVDFSEHETLLNYGIAFGVGF